MSRENQLKGHSFVNEHRAWADLDVLKRGKAEFEEYARQTWAGLTEVSYLQSGSRGLELFGRLDVGVLSLGPHTFQFYVNEVERSATCNLFNNNFTHEGHPVIWQLAKEIPEYCRKNRRSA